MIISILSLLCRVGIFISSIITLALNAKFLNNASWANDILIYIIAISSFSAVACLVPPYPNFVFDLFWALANGLAAVFALVVQFSESNCYGFRPGTTASCATYKAGTAFTSLLGLAWFGSALLGSLRILGVVFNIGQRDTGSSIQEQEQEQHAATQRALRERFYRHPTDKKGGKNEQEQKTEEQTVAAYERKRIEGFGNEHVARNFIFYGLLAIVLLAAGIPLFIVYAAPAFAVYIIDNAPLPDTDITLLNPTNDSIAFSVFSDITVPAAVSVRLDSMSAEFFRTGNKDDLVSTPFASVDIPKLKFKSNQKIAITNQTMKLGDTDEFARMIEEVSVSERFDVAVRARADVGIASLSRGIDIVKVDSMDGFNNFPNIGVNDISIKSRDEQGNNIYAEIVIFNSIPAVVTLGNVTLSLNLANQSIGQATVFVDNIIPGNNTFTVRANLNGEVLSEHIEDIIREQIPYLKQGQIKASASGFSVVYNGLHLEYWEKAFRKTSISATRPVREILDMVMGNGVGGDNDNGEDGGGLLDIPGLPGLGDLGLGGGLDSIVDGLVDQILDKVKDLDEDEEDEYAEELATVRKLVLRLLTSLGVL